LQYPAAERFHTKSVSCRRSGSYTAPSAARLDLRSLEHNCEECGAGQGQGQGQGVHIFHSSFYC
jgi:hypothetical protein